MRTSEYKLVKYPSHPEWTQLLNIKTDPFEMKNLADNPELLQRMEAEFARQADIARFRIPDVVKDRTAVKDSAR